MVYKRYRKVKKKSMTFPSHSNQKKIKPVTAILLSTILGDKETII